MRTIAIVVLSIAACAACTTTGSSRSENFPIVVGTDYSRSDVKPCIDYAAKFTRSGYPYRVYVPKTGGGTELLTRHEGMDFCAPAGTPVYSASSGRVSTIIWENPRRGGWVIVSTDVKAKRVDKESAYEGHIFLTYIHIVPNEKLRLWRSVKPGDLIGHLEPPGKPEIGRQSHLHFAASTCENWWVCHTDPNRFWQRGPGQVTCLDASNPPTGNEIVSPMRC